MDLSLYQSLSMNTEKQYPRDMRLKHAAVGLQTEIGEFATQVKRVAIYEKKLTDVKEGKSLIDHMVEELGDAMWYAVIPFNEFGIDAGKLVSQEHSWAQIAAARLGALDGAHTLEDLSEEFRNTLLLAVTLQIGVEIGRFIQNSASEVFARAIAAAIICLIKDASRLLGVPFDVILQQNIDKLQGANGRYGSAGYSNAAAEARADKGGADARSS